MLCLNQTLNRTENRKPYKASTPLHEEIEIETQLSKKKNRISKKLQVTLKIVLLKAKWQFEKALNANKNEVLAGLICYYR